MLTVVLHQILSIIAERGGVRADGLHELICGPGPFVDLEGRDFIALLRAVAAPEIGLLEQAPDGTIMLGPMGERLVSSRDFYAVFESDEEWRLVTSGRTLGTIPIVNVLGVGSLLGFAGRRWRVAAVDDIAKVLEVVPHPAGRLPKFDRLAFEPVHDRLVAEMRSVFLDTDIPAFVDATALQLLAEGRLSFAELGLSKRRLLPSGRDTHLLLWRGTAVNGLVAILLMAAGLECEAHDVGVTVAATSPDELASLICQLKSCPSLEDLAGFVQNIRGAKYDDFLPEDLLQRIWVKRHHPLQGVVNQVLEELRTEFSQSH